MGRATDIAPDRHPDIRRGIANQVLQGIDDYGSAKKYADNVDFPAGYEHIYDGVVSKANDLGLKPHTGKTYEVNINADPEHFLDWDKPLNEQSPQVQEMLGKVSSIAPEYLKSKNLTGGQIVPQTPQGVQEMAQAGIPGIKYLDQGSRGTGTGTSNYVVFNDKLVNIVKKYGMAGLIAGGAAHYSTTPVDHQPEFAQ